MNAKILFPLGIAASVASAADAPAAPFELKGNVQLQGSHRFESEAPNEFLNDSWVRANFGGKLKAEDLNAEINLRVFPTNYGNSNVTDVAQDTNGVVTATKKSQDRLQVEQAWVEYLFGSAAVKLGHYSTSPSRSTSIGNYIDADAGISFQGKVTYHDAMEVSHKMNAFSCGARFDATSKNMNTMDITLLGAFKDKAIPVDLELAYKTNIWNSIKDDKAPTLNRMEARTSYAVSPELIPYVNVAMVDVYDAKKGMLQSQQIPVLFGIQVQALKNTQVNLEAEYVGDRTVTPDGKTKWDNTDPADNEEDRALDIALSVSQKLGSRCKFQALVGSDPKANNIMELQTAVRMTTTIN